LSVQFHPSELKRHGSNGAGYSFAFTAGYSFAFTAGYSFAFTAG
jgi:hypothetical protein